MRIAILASPRSGNNWVRRIMSAALMYPHFASHAIDDFLADLPTDCILNVHAPCDRRTRDFFEQRLCKVMVLARHPLDIFVSVLQFSRNEPGVYQWLGGACEIPQNANRLSPNDEQWVDWMTGDGAKRLLSVSLDWWNHPDSAVRVRYEDLLTDQVRQFQKLCEIVKCQDSAMLCTTLFPSAASIESALNKYSVNYFAQFNNHGWLGTKENYSLFITKPNCERIFFAHREYFEALDYDVQSDPFLCHAKASQNYHRVNTGRYEMT